MKNLRRYYWLVTEFVKRHGGVILRTIATVIILSLLTILFINYIPTPRRTLRIGLVGKYTLETLPSIIQEKLSKGLVKIENGEPKPAIAKDWQVSDDGKTYLFNLDPSLKWSDGSAIKPEEINYNFKDVEVRRGENSITFVLRDPFAPFFYAVEKPILKNSEIGVGPYTIGKKVVSSSVLQQISLIDPDEKLIYKFYPTESSVLTAFKLGEIDKIYNLSTIPPEFEKTANIIIEPSTTNRKIAVLFFNNNDANLNSKSTRQALAYAIEDKSMGRERVLSPISNSSWAYNSLVKDYGYDPEKALTLFEQDIKDRSNFKLELKTTLQYLDEAEQIAQSWRTTLGIQVDVKVVTTITNDYQALLADYAPPADPDQYTIWHSTQPTNFTHYTNLKVDKLLEDGRRTRDKKLRKEIYQDFQRFLLEDCPAVFLFNTSSFNLSRKPIFSN